MKRGEARFVAGHHIERLTGGGEFFPALEQSIARARVEISLETYIFRDDAVGWRIAHALADAARRGVTVRVLVDGFGSRELSPALPDLLRAAGALWRVYRPERGWLRASPLRLRRLHRKLAIIDGHEAFVGGINVEADTDPPRLDYALRLQGPLVARLRLSMERLWRRTAWAEPHEPWAASLPEAKAGDVAIALLLRDNLRHRRDIERAYLRAILDAREEVLIACAYFLPGRGLRRALRMAARRGVRVTLLLQGMTDHPLVRRASRAGYGRLLADGVVIHEYTRAELHAKAAVVDGALKGHAWATVGSSNLDPFSLLVAREANVALRDAAFARNLREHLRGEIDTHARRIDARAWAEQPWWTRWMESAAQGWVRVLMTLTGLGRY